VDLSALEDLIIQYSIICLVDAKSIDINTLPLSHNWCSTTVSTRYATVILIGYSSDMTLSSTQTEDSLILEGPSFNLYISYLRPGLQPPKVTKIVTTILNHIDEAASKPCIWIGDLNARFSSHVGDVTWNKRGKSLWPIIKKAHLHSFNAEFDINPTSVGSASIVDHCFGNPAALSSCQQFHVVHSTPFASDHHGLSFENTF
jgi:hypothetical protein